MRASGLERRAMFCQQAKPRGGAQSEEHGGATRDAGESCRGRTSEKVNLFAFVITRKTEDAKATRPPAGSQGGKA